MRTPSWTKEVSRAPDKAPETRHRPDAGLAAQSARSVSCQAGSHEPIRGVAMVMLMRHPRTALRQDIILGQIDADLAPEEVEQLPGLAGIAAALSPKRIVSSDLRRCSRLGQMIADAAEVPLEIDSVWREQSFGDWEGLTWDEVAESFPDEHEKFFKHWVTRRPPGGESFAEVARRIEKALQKLSDGPKTLVITHAGPIRGAVSIAAGNPLEDAFDVDVEHGQVVELEAWP